MIDVVNTIFRELIVAEPESQPEYVALEPVREPRRDRPRGRAARHRARRRGHHRRRPARARGRRRRRGRAARARARAGRWCDGRRTRRRDTERVEPCRLGDICILLPARTSLGHLEDALDAAGIPYRAETSSLVYSTREIRDLLVVLQAVDDPTDELALVSALRSPIFGCGDDDLYTFKVEHGGRWDHQRPLPETLPADHPVADAMRALAEWHDARYWSSPSELLDRIVRERRVLEVGFAHGRPRDLWRRVRFVVEQARAFADAEGGSVRDFLAWADLQGSEGARVVETVLPETDDDAVRILTIHGAKGLEFPITIVSGMTTKAAGRARPACSCVFPHDRDTYALRVSSRVTTEEFERYAPIDEQMDFHEKLRLLYVAMTRARDHLVVSVHRPAKEPPVDRTTWTHAELVWHAAAEQPGWEAFAAGADDLVALDARRRRTTDRRRGRRRRRGTTGVLGARRAPASESARRRRAVAPPRWPRERRGRPRRPTPAVDPGLAKGPRDLELPPWNKGRYGTALGRAVHAVLQTVDLATGAGLDDAAAAQAAAEGIVGTRGRGRGAGPRARSRRASVQEAVAHGFRREMYVATPVDGTTLEGYVDLVYRRPDGLVVVDYKTDAWSSDADLDAKVARYRLQGAAYAGRARAGDRRDRRRVRVRVPRRPRRRAGAGGQRSAGGDA